MNEEMSFDAGGPFDVMDGEMVTMPYLRFIQSKIRGLYVGTCRPATDLAEGFGMLVTRYFAYMGYFMNNKFHGRGWLTNINDSVYEGEFRNGEFEG